MGENAVTWYEETKVRRVTSGNYFFNAFNDSEIWLGLHLVGSCRQISATAAFHPKSAN